MHYRNWARLAVVAISLFSVAGCTGMFSNERPEVAKTPGAPPQLPKTPRVNGAESHVNSVARNVLGLPREEQSKYVDYRSETE